jgi:hypothetical protein
LVATKADIYYYKRMDYFNAPELNGKYLGTIPKDFATVCLP